MFVWCEAAVEASVLITGATGGMGKALAAACAARGWPLYLTDTSADPLDALCIGLQREFGIDVRTRTCDLTSVTDRAALWQAIEREGLRFWMVLNVAGLDYQGPFAERDLDKLITLARLNVEAVIEMCHRALAHRDTTRTLRLVNVASFAAFFPMPGKAVYAASKSFVLSLSRALHVELRGRDVTVTTVCPAGMPTAPRTIVGIEALGTWGRLTATPVNMVAERTIRAALRGDALYVPGTINRVIRAMSRLVPESWRVRWIASRWSRKLDEANTAPKMRGAATPARYLPGQSVGQDLAGHTIVVTGATDGLGRATLEALAARGARVIGIGRSAERCREVEQATRDRWPGSCVQLIVADLSAQREVRRAAVEVRALLAAEGAPLDALVNNAGTVSTWFAATEDGYERQFATNYLAGFLLTHELLPLLKAAPAGRIVNVSSRSHRGARIAWGDVMLRRGYSILRAYRQSKLADALFTAELNRRLGPRSTLQAFAADPGLVSTSIGQKNTGGLAELVWRLRRRGGAPPEMPARNIVFLATDPAADVNRGWYWRDCRPLRPSHYARNAAHAARLWALSARLCGTEVGPNG